MNCPSCQANNSQMSSSCSNCGSNLTSAANQTPATNEASRPPKMFLREPGSSLYVIRALSDKELKTGVPPIDLKDIPYSEWAALFDDLHASQFALSSNLYPELDALVTSSDGYLFIYNHSTLKFKKNKPFPVGPAIATLLIPDTPSGQVLALDLKVANSVEVAQVAKDFFELPREILARHNWQPYDDGSSQGPASPSNQGNGFTPAPVTTYFVTEGFDF